MTELIDFHSHVLPGVDDGSESIEQSLALLRMAAEQGVTYVVATPHFYADRDTLEQFLTRRAQSEALLRAAMSQCAGLPELLIGAEVRYFPGISQSEAVRSLTIAGKDCILLEMPETIWTESMYQELEQLYLQQGVLPILAHLERYLSPRNKRKVLQRLARLPMAVQVNASFFLRWNTRSLAMKLLQQERIHVLGSDCHNLTSRKPNLAQAADRIRNRLGEDALKRIYSESCALLKL